MTSKKVAVAMSGGIDSSMAAKMLVDEGCDVFGIYLKLHGNEDTHARNIANIRKVCDYLGIKYDVVGLEESFQKFVVNPFVEYYKSGLTPNPCTFCNREIKFGALFEAAKRAGRDYLATGHYVRVSNGLLREAADKSKDQSYFLFNVKKEVLPYLIFPLGDSIKSALKEEAMNIEAFSSLSAQKESSEICFVEGSYIDTLCSFGVDTGKEGAVLDENGAKIGTHRGYMNYTVGQRKGFDVPLSHTPLYVKEIDAANNTITVSHKEAAFESSFDVGDLNMFVDKKEFECFVKVRYRSEKAPATVEIKDGAAKVTLKTPQFAIAKGQAAVFYEDDLVIGGGYII